LTFFDIEGIFVGILFATLLLGARAGFLTRCVVIGGDILIFSFVELGNV